LRLIARLSNIITAVKKFVFGGALPRMCCYIIILLFLLALWLLTEQADIPFVYNEF
jgi:hypothetical protein